MSKTKNLLLELFDEELPPKALHKLGKAFGKAIHESLQQQELIDVAAAMDADPRKIDDVPYDVFATPRRLAVLVRAVSSIGKDIKPEPLKLMPVSVGLDDQGQPTQALLKKLTNLGRDVSDVAAVVARLKQQLDGKTMALFDERVEPGVTLSVGLQKALDEALTKLPIPKVMQYQLETDCELPGWSSVKFVRPAHRLLALHGSDVVPVKALGLMAGQTTQGHRFEAKKDLILIPSADQYEELLRDEGAVIASFTKRREQIKNQLADAAAKVGGGVQPINDDALLDEVTALVERPNVLVCQFEKQFLAVPQECLILTMKANQKYFPLLDAQGKLTNRFLVVSNIGPDDPSAVISGNERVVRPRLADAKFFFDQDRKKSLSDRVEGLAKVVYHNKLGTQGERTERVRVIARALALTWPDSSTLLVEQVDTAARLAKTDLLTDMVGEFPELQGIMGGYYARHDGLGEVVAQAIEDHYKPRFSGDELPRNDVGLVVALADKLETLVGMFGIGNLPTGDKDPFALRRHALGVIRMIIERNLPYQPYQLCPWAWESFPVGILTHDWAKLEEFFQDRLRGYLRDWGYSAQEVEAVLQSRGMTQWSDVSSRLQAVRAFVALSEAPALAAANKRIGNILKKASVPLDRHSLSIDVPIDSSLLSEPAEMNLNDAMRKVLPVAKHFDDKGEFTASLQQLAQLRPEVDAFFEHVMVNANDVSVRKNRQNLLRTLYAAMNRVADLSQLAV